MAPAVHCKTDAKFELFPCNEKVYVCDQGATLCSLEEKVELNPDVREEAKRIAAESGAELIDEKLCVEVPSAERTLACLFRLYSAMERVSRIGDLLPGGASKKEAVPAEFIEALEYIVRTQKASIIDLHAKFGCSPNTIGLMFEWMEEKGFITPLGSLKEGRKVLLTMEEFNRRFGKK